MRFKAVLVVIMFLWLALGASPRNASSPVLVELFTSQGCSSCPAADEVISQWGKAAFERGEIVPLSFHVDYWDSIGWKDLFSSAAFTDRQRRYAAVFRSENLYTPQMVVAGRVGFVGSDRSRAEREVGLVRGATLDARFDIKKSWNSSLLRLTVSANAPPFRIRREPHIFLALFENGLVTRVRRGENAGRTMRGDFVVRSLRDLGSFPVDKEDLFRRDVEIPWDSGWKKENAGAAVFLQDEKTMEIFDAQSLFPLLEG